MQNIHSLLNHNPSKKVLITDSDNLTIGDIINSASPNTQVTLEFSNKRISKFNTINTHVLEQVKSGTPIYGATSAYGAQASRVLNHGEEDVRLENARALSRAIVHVDVSTGKPLPFNLVKAAMTIRVNMLKSGHSGVKIETLNSLTKLINSGFVPVVGRFGTLGASGDLAQNGRVVSTLLQLDHIQVKDSKGKRYPAKSKLSLLGIDPVSLEAKEGLGLVNGDNFSTAAAALIVHELTQLLHTCLISSALITQALKASDRNFHPILHHLRPHPGQKYISETLLSLITDSKLIHHELKGPKARAKGEIIQDPYSIRCIPQYFGKDVETIEAAIKTITINANSVSDNPIWTDPETTTAGEKPYQWVSGGNFLAMHMSDTLDSLRKIAIRIVKLNDRHLARLINPLLNNGLPANLSTDSAVSHCTFKGVQTQMGMYEVYASLLASPVSTAFGVHEELNQDITSHAMTSAIITWEVLKLVRLSLASNLIASCQAIDLLEARDKLSPATLPTYKFIRDHVPFIKEEQPLGHYIENISKLLLSPKLTNIFSNRSVKTNES